MRPHQLHTLAPGATFEGDWFNGKVPDNIEVGSDTLIDSSFCFKQFFSVEPVGLRVGNHVTLWRTSLATEENGLIEIGDYSYLTNASIVCTGHITIGARVMIAGGVTIADSDLHPTPPAARMADTIALSPIGERSCRPAAGFNPIIIEDDVWIGYNAAILKGARIGAGAVIAPGAVVIRDVPPGAYVAGNPANITEPPPR